MMSVWPSSFSPPFTLVCALAPQYDEPRPSPDRVLLRSPSMRSPPVGRHCTGGPYHCRAGRVSGGSTRSAGCMPISRTARAAVRGRRLGTVRPVAHVSGCLLALLVELAVEARFEPPKLVLEPPMRDGNHVFSKEVTRAIAFIARHRHCTEVEVAGQLWLPMLELHIEGDGPPALYRSLEVPDAGLSRCRKQPGGDHRHTRAYDHPVHVNLLVGLPRSDAPTSVESRAPPCP